jgi:hypothetical protein
MLFPFSRSEPLNLEISTNHWRNCRFVASVPFCNRKKKKRTQFHPMIMDLPEKTNPMLTPDSRNIPIHHRASRVGLAAPWLSEGKWSKKLEKMRRSVRVNTVATWSEDFCDQSSLDFWPRTKKTNPMGLPCEAQGEAGSRNDAKTQKDRFHQFRAAWLQYVRARSLKKANPM